MGTHESVIPNRSADPDAGIDLYRSRPPGHFSRCFVQTV